MTAQEERSPGTYLEVYSQGERRRAKEGQPDVYIYDAIPEPFRRQVIYIWRQALPYRDGYPITHQLNELWLAVQMNYCEAKGLDYIAKGHSQNAYEQYFLSANDEDALDLIGTTFLVISAVVARMEQWKQQNYNIGMEPEAAIEKLNFRFGQHDLGYRFTGTRLIRIDSEYLHRETVVPAIALLSDARFRGANEEFLRAHEHYRKGRSKEAITEALKAFESAMKTICVERGWPLSGSESASNLVAIMLDNGLIPDFLQDYFTGGLKKMLEAGLPTVRNKRGAHGQGQEQVAVPDYLAAYALHHAAANIVLLVEASSALPR